MSRDSIVAIAFLTRSGLERLSVTLDCCYPLADDGVFNHLLSQLDRIEVESSEIVLVAHLEPDGQT